MKKIGIAIVTIIVLALGAIIMYNQTISGEYTPADDEIVLNIQLNTKEDIGLLIYDYCANDHQYSGGMSNADRSLLKRDDRLVVVWNKQALNEPSSNVELSVQFRIITVYVDPNYENIYPEEITQYLAPISWGAHLGGAYCVTITSDKVNGYTAVLNE